jgi:hypothetical protein
MTLVPILIVAATLFLLIMTVRAMRANSVAALGRSRSELKPPQSAAQSHPPSVQKRA